MPAKGKKRWLLGLLLLAPLAAGADDASIESAWPMPPTAQAERTAIAPSRVFDIRENAGLLGVKAGFVLPGGRILFWGDGSETYQRAISTINPADGHIETLWRSNEQDIRAFYLTPDGKALWFSTSKPERLHVLDIASQRIWSMEEIYGQGAELLQNALQRDVYREVRMEPDGRLLLEWRHWYAIANWWGKTPADWGMPDGGVSRRKPAGRDVYSRAYLPSPAAWLAQGGQAPRLAVAFDVSFQKQIYQILDRPKPLVTGEGRFYGPLHDGWYFSPLHRYALPEHGVSVQLFNRYRNPQTMAECAAGDGGYGGSSTDSTRTCALFQGAYVERTTDGKLLHTLNHGVGVPRGSIVRGRLFALSGNAEKILPAPYVSLWDAPAGKLLAHFALPEEAVYYTNPGTLLFSSNMRELYCLTGYAHPKLFVWPLDAAWRELTYPRAASSRPAKKRTP